MGLQDSPNKEQALPGRDDKISVSDKHFVNGNTLNPPFDKDLQQIIFDMGCFGEQNENSGRLTVPIQRRLVILDRLSLEY